MTRLAFAALLLASPAFAQQPPQQRCAARAEITAMLANQFLEVPLTRGFDPAAGVMVEMWGNPVSGTWTLLVTRPDQSVCILGDGEMLEVTEYEEPIIAPPESEAQEHKS
jgi:hypothetical protein